MINSAVGYTGGEGAATPTYESVCARNNTYTEALRLVYDPAVVSYEDLVRRFVADPRVRTAGRPSAIPAGLQLLVQTRRAVWAQDEEQAAVARRVLRESGKDTIPVLPPSAWIEAEEYHQHHIAEAKDYPDLGEDDPWAGGSWGL